MNVLEVKTFLETVNEDPYNIVERDAVLENIDHIPANDTVSLYFRQMASEPLLTAQMEVELARQIERGIEAQRLLDEYPDLPYEQVEKLWSLSQAGIEAREHLSAANTRLVVSIAKRYRNQGLPMSDLIQEGNVGLMIAVDKFDYTMGNRFSTYASWWIRQTITRALSQKSRVIRLPLNLSDQLRRINVARDMLGQELGREARTAEIAEWLDMEVEDVTDIIESQIHTIALETPVGDDSEFGDFIEDDLSPSPDDAMNSIAMKEALESALALMLPRDAQILRLRFGLGGGQPQTLEQVGDEMGLSRERIRQIERQALRNLRQPQFETLLRDFASV